MKAWEAFYGPNEGYVQELYERYQHDPNSVDPDTRAFFEEMSSGVDGQNAIATLARPSTITPLPEVRNGRRGVKAQPSEPGVTNGADGSSARAAPAVVEEQLTGDTVGRIVRAARLARSIREYGHLAADIDPLSQPRPGDPMLDLATHRITDADLTALPASIVWPA